MNSSQLNASVITLLALDFGQESSWDTTTTGELSRNWRPEDAEEYLYQLCLRHLDAEVSTEPTTISNDPYTLDDSMDEAVNLTGLCRKLIAMRKKRNQESSWDITTTGQLSRNWTAEEAEEYLYQFCLRHLDAQVSTDAPEKPPTTISNDPYTLDDTTEEAYDLTGLCRKLIAMRMDREAYKEDVEAYEWYEEVNTRLWRGVAPVLLVLGTLGNVLTVTVILHRKALRSSTTCLYLVVLAVLDVLVLYTNLLGSWLSYLKDVDVTLVSQASCKVYVMLTHLFMHVEAWVLVNMSLERVVAVWLPMLYKKLFTKTRAALGLIITGLLLMAINLHFVWTVELGTAGEHIYCNVFKQQYRVFHQYSWPWIHFSLTSAVPFTIMLAVAVAIIAHFKCGRSPSSASSEVNSMTAMLMTVTMTYIVLTGPSSVYTAWRNLHPLPLYTAKSGRHALLKSALLIIHFCNYAINFILYCAIGPRFRKELHEMFCHTRVHPETQHESLENAS